MQQPRTYIQHTIIQSACACATIMHTASTHTVSTHTISQHVIRIQPAHNHAAARTLSSFKQLKKLQIRRAVKRICHSCTHSHNNNHHPPTITISRTLFLHVFERAVYLELENLWHPRQASAEHNVKQLPCTRAARGCTPRPA